jgi:histidinol phosphatase-like enzyme (inositol monophosphatase family)
MPSDPTDLAAFCKTLADGAREVSCRYFRTRTAVDVKADDSPVTRADRETEAFLRTRIADTYPEAGLFGEEEGAGRLDSTLVFVVDPIDGTKSFITGSPLFGTLISVLRDGRPIVGVIDMPAMDERWVGVDGQLTVYRWGEREIPCATRAGVALDGAVVTTTSPDMFEPNDWQRFDRVSRAARLRRFGGDCYQYGRLTSGEVDVVAEGDLKPYDYLALVPIVEGAGGTITDWAGDPLGLHSDGRVLAAGNADLHAEVLAALKP